MRALVDHELLTVKLQELDRYLTQLKKHQGVSERMLENDLDKAWIIQHGLQLCIQVVLDVGNHILASKGVSVQEYADIFVELARLKVLPEGYAESIKGMPGLRNLLVHEYAGLDMSVLAGIVNNRLRDFYLFASHITEYFNNH